MLVLASPCLFGKYAIATSRPRLTHELGFRLLNCVASHIASPFVFCNSGNIEYLRVKLTSAISSGALMLLDLRELTAAQNI
jgi:hypothetical protein